MTNHENQWYDRRDVVLVTWEHTWNKSTVPRTRGRCRNMWATFWERKRGMWETECLLSRQERRKGCQGLRQHRGDFDNQFFCCFAQIAYWSVDFRNVRIVSNDLIKFHQDLLLDHYYRSCRLKVTVQLRITLDFELRCNRTLISFQVT